MRFRVILYLLCLIPLFSFANDRVLNIYAWSGEIPDSVIRQFEEQSGIKVNLSTYDNNEIMYAKLRSMKNIGYDIIIPSSYFVDRMTKQNMLERIDKQKLSNWKNLNPSLLHLAYDPQSEYSIPFLWGIAGIFYNTNYYATNSIKKWTDLWDAKFRDQLLLLDDTREVFSMGLLSLGYPANDKNPEHLQNTYLSLRKLMENVKVFSSDMVVSIIIDEDVKVGMAWNGDVYKAQKENKNIQFVYPEDGFVIWVDNFSIPKNAPHKDNAYVFLNFILDAEVGKRVALYTHYATANLAAQNRLPQAVRENPIIYPSKEILKRGQFQVDLGEDTLNLYEKYWEELKLGN